MDQSTDLVMSPQATKTLLAAARTAGPRERALLEEEVVTAHLPLAARIAGRYRGRGIDVEDLRQVANTALVKAVRRFDPSRGEFMSFAAVTVSGEVKKHFRDAGWMVRPPRSIQLLQVEMGHVEDARARAGCAAPGVDELARELGVDRSAVVDAAAARGCFAPTSLDAPVRGGGRTLGDALAADDVDLDVVDRWVDFQPVWKVLDDAEKQLITLRFFDDLTQEQIARIIGSNQMQVSRALRALLAKIRRHMAIETAA